MLNFIRINFAVKLSLLAYYLNIFLKASLNVWSLETKSAGFTVANGCRFFSVNKLYLIILNLYSSTKSVSPYRLLTICLYHNTNNIHNHVTQYYDISNAYKSLLSWSISHFESAARSTSRCHNLVFNFNMVFLYIFFVVFSIQVNFLIFSLWYTTQNRYEEQYYVTRLWLSNLNVRFFTWVCYTLLNRYK